MAQARIVVAGLVEEPIREILATNVVGEDLKTWKVSRSIFMDT